jgi:hypothetical protein
MSARSQVEERVDGGRVPRRQRGAAALALLLVLCSVAAMLGALAIRGAVADQRIAGAQRRSRTAFYCAEAGLQASRAWFAGNYGQWNAMFDTSHAPPAGYPVSADIDGDGLADYQVTLRDNVDEFPPLANNPLQDNDLTAVMVSRCASATLGNRTVEEIVVVNTRGTSYRTQAGHGSNHAGNEN